MTDQSVSRERTAWLAVMPVLFVFLWATGFVGAKLGLPYAPPMTFLALRFALACVLMVIVALVLRASWPGSVGMVGHIAVSGVLIHGVYLGGVFSSISNGVSAGLTALIVSLQPLLTACLVGPFLGESITARQWLGFVLGLLGVALVVQGNVRFEGSELTGLGYSLLALIGITTGVLYQKRFNAEADIRTTAVIHFGAAGAVCMALAYAGETVRVVWSGEFVFALGWLVVILSLGAFSLLYLLIRRGAAAKVSSLFYLVPPVAALMGWVLFGETLDVLGIVGMVVAAVGVALVNR